MGELNSIRRGLGMLLKSAPIAASSFFLISVLLGIGPNIVILASARLVGLAPRLADSGDARSEAVIAVAVIGIALAVTQGAQALTGTLYGYVGFRFQAAFDARRIAAVTALPGLEHFESPELADRLHGSTWAASIPRNLLNHGTSLLHWFTSGVVSLLIITRLGWWVPLLILIAATPVVVTRWRHALVQSSLFRVGSPELRYAGYHASLALETAASKELRLFRLGDWLLDRQRRLWKKAMDPVFADMRREFRTRLLIALGIGATFLPPLVVAVGRLRTGRISTEDFSAVILALANIGTPLGFVESMAAEFRRAASFLPEAFAVFDLPANDPRLESGRVAPSRALEREIRFEGVRFAYPGTDQFVLDGVDLVLPAGASLALVGENGAGKSTLVKLLCRFYDPTEGRITLDGRDFRDYDLHELRSQFAVVFQDFMRLPMSVAENVGVGCVERKDDAELRDLAARLSGTDDVLKLLPRGWDTILAREFDGIDLSGGEWQRVAMGRAMATLHGRRASLLVLDEPTAALDVRLEHELYERFASLTKDVTTLLISHRFSTVQMADSVAVLGGGRIVEEGTHRDLLAADGVYAGLYELQARRFRDAGVLE